MDEEYFKKAFRYLIEKHRHEHGDDHCPLRGFCKTCTGDCYCVLGDYYP